METNQLFKEWIEKAEEDFGFASINLKDSANRYHAQVCYHFQQAAEKYLKAFVVGYNLEFKKVHDLTELLRICTEKEPSFSSLRPDCEFLTDYYIDTRYPVAWPAKIDLEEANRAKKCTENIRNFVKRVLDLE